jgi:uncharacterized membrane protein YgdD (TMEM256/DUF423 family)
MSAGWFATGALTAGLGVVLGAFGAHALRGRLTQEMLGVFETGVRYHLVHALALLSVGWAASRWPGPWTSGAGWAFLGGIVVFCGSLYLVSITGARWLGAITPLGGAGFILGWVLLAVGALRGGGFPGSR